MFIFITVSKKSIKKWNRLNCAHIFHAYGKINGISTFKHYSLSMYINNLYFSRLIVVFFLLLHFWNSSSFNMVRFSGGFSDNHM